jgi:hypothetical protein
MTEIATEPNAGDPFTNPYPTVRKNPEIRYPTLTAFYAAIAAVLLRDPTKVWTPKEIAIELHVNVNRVTKALNRAVALKLGKKPIPVVKVLYGHYQYESPDEVPLNQMVERHGKLGVENLVYYKLAGPVRLGDTSHNNAESELEPDPFELDESQAISKPGYPRRFKTGQEVRWLIWPNGTEMVHFVSHGRPFSFDWLIDLHDQLEREGLIGKQWSRKSIEYNVDTLNVTLRPEYIDLQLSKGKLLKTYNHGQQFRKEVADRTSVSHLKTIEELLYHYDASAVQVALRNFETLESRVNEMEREIRHVDEIARIVNRDMQNHVTAEERSRRRSQNT